MTKKKEVKTKKENPADFYNLIDKYIPQKYQTPVFLFLLFLSVVVFFAPVYFGNMTFQSGDILTQLSYKNFQKLWGEQLWDPYIFCGMPMFGDAGWNDFFGMLIRKFVSFYSSLLANEYGGYSIYLIALGFTVFYLSRHLKLDRTISLFVSISVMFSIGIVTLLFIGHINKLSTLSMFPLVLLMIMRLKQKIKLLDIIILLLALKFMFSQWHIQIIYYTYLIIGIYLLFYFIMSLIEKNKDAMLQVIKVGLILVVVTGAGYAMHYFRLGQIYEYTDYSTRGTKSILDLETKSQTSSDEEFYQYSTNWSFSPGEIMTFVFPSFYGFGNSTYQGPLTQNQPVEVNTYFGQMPFTDAALYMGIIVLALAFIGVFTNRKDKFVQFLVIISIFTLILSFGRTLPLLYDLFYHYMPFFNKFRVPVMILNIFQITIPLLAAYGLKSLITINEKDNKSLSLSIKYLVFISAGLLVISLILSNPITNWFTGRIDAHIASIKSSRQQLAAQFEALKPYMNEMFIADVRIAFGLLTILFALLYSYINRKINFSVLMLFIIVLTIFDLWRITNRALHYREAEPIKNLFNTPDYVKAIKDRNDNEPFRIFNVKQDGSMGSMNQNSNFHTYFLLEDFYGYSALKPRSYQDFIDVVGPINSTMWRMLNVKYIIAEQPVAFEGLRPVSTGDKSTVHLNELALPRAYFVDSVSVKTSMQFLQDVKQNNFDPKHVAFLTNAIDQKIDRPDSTVKVEIINYEYLNITMNVKASGNNFLFIGNTYYPKGWNAKIAGDETKIFRTNHGFMGIVVPKGEHKVELYYESPTFELGTTISLILNMIILLGISVVVYTVINEKKKTK